MLRQTFILHIFYTEDAVIHANHASVIVGTWKLGLVVYGTI